MLCFMSMWIKESKHTNPACPTHNSRRLKRRIPSNSCPPASNQPIMASINIECDGFVN
uniref:Uncharacterized protein n=1 Tax=Arundo donax TaxID=35708 RepID=A0A0A9CWC9_ARUDO